MYSKVQVSVAAIVFQNELRKKKKAMDGLKFGIRVQKWARVAREYFVPMFVGPSRGVMTKMS